MSKYEYTEDMGEISGFGGGYEGCCRKMVIAGLEWWDAHPDADPQFTGYRDVYGIIKENNEDAEALTKAVIDASRNDEGVSEATGAMHQATISHVLFAHRKGWDTYCENMRGRKSE